MIIGVNSLNNFPAWRSILKDTVWTGVPKPGGDGGIYPTNNLAVSPPIVWVWSTSASTPIIWLGCASECRCPLEIGEKKCSIFGEDLFFGLHLNLGKKSVPFLVKTFFLVFTWFAHLNKIVVVVHPVPMLKIGQKMGKIANYPPHCSTKIGIPGCEASTVRIKQVAAM